MFVYTVFDSFQYTRYIPLTCIRDELVWNVPYYIYLSKIAALNGSLLSMGGGEC